MDHIDYRAPKPSRRTLKRSCTPKHHLNNATFAHSEPACRTYLLPMSILVVMPQAEVPLATEAPPLAGVQAALLSLPSQRLARSVAEVR